MDFDPYVPVASYSYTVHLRFMTSFDIVIEGLVSNIEADLCG